MIRQFFFSNILGLITSISCLLFVKTTLAIMFMENDIMDNINFDPIIQEFMERKYRKCLY